MKSYLVYVEAETEIEVLAETPDEAKFEAIRRAETLHLSELNVSATVVDTQEVDE